MDELDKRFDIFQISENQFPHVKTFITLNLALYPASALFFYPTALKQDGELVMCYAVRLFYDATQFK